jgi:hypothetical protein
MTIDAGDAGYLSHCRGKKPESKLSPDWTSGERSAPAIC